MKEIKVDRQTEGIKLIRFLGKMLPAASSSFIYKMLRKKNITLNEKKGTGSEILKEGDVIKIFFSDRGIGVVKFTESCKMIALAVIFFSFKGDKITGEVNIIRTVTVKLVCESIGKKLSEHFQRVIGDTGHYQRAAEIRGEFFQLREQLFVVAAAGSEPGAGGSCGCHCCPACCAFLLLRRALRASFC